MQNNDLENQIDKEINNTISIRQEENLIVYEAVKNTALRCEDCIRNARIYMYVAYFALLTICLRFQLSFINLIG